MMVISPYFIYFFFFFSEEAIQRDTGGYSYLSLNHGDYIKLMAY